MAETRHMRGAGPFPGCGKWVVREHGSRTLTIQTNLTVGVEDAGGTVAGMVIGSTMERKRARLIAAAPQMYEALESVEMWIREARPGTAQAEILADVRAALRAARGEE